MIQRIQTLFLSLVIILSILLIYLPVYVFPDIATLAQGTMKSYAIGDNVLLSIINGVVGVLALVTIFLFKQRNLQLRLCNVNLLLLCILTGLLFFLADTMGTSLDHRVSYKYGAYLPLIQLIFTFLAVRAIRKDEELVRSADRIR
jgi:uncharacterized membrane protein